jgi:hypothetical protein
MTIRLNALSDCPSLRGVIAWGQQPKSHRTESLRLPTGSALGIVAALAALVLAGAAVFSSAAFTASTANAANTFSTAADWNPPTVSLASPGAAVKGTTTLTADASDAESGLRSLTIEYQRATVSLSTGLFNSPGLMSAVRVEYSVAGANKWDTLCVDLIAPYNCSWATGFVANGEYDLRAVAVSGFSSTYSETVTDVLVDNAAPTASMVDPALRTRGGSVLLRLEHGHGPERALRFPRHPHRRRGEGDHLRRRDRTPGGQHPPCAQRMSRRPTVQAPPGSWTPGTP